MKLDDLLILFTSAKPRGLAELSTLVLEEEGIVATHLMDLRKKGLVRESTNFWVLTAEGMQHESGIRRILLSKIGEKDVITPFLSLVFQKARKMAIICAPYMKNKWVQNLIETFRILALNKVRTWVISREADSGTLDVIKGIFLAFDSRDCLTVEEKEKLHMKIYIADDWVIFGSINPGSYSDEVILALRDSELAFETKNFFFEYLYNEPFSLQ